MAIAGLSEDGPSTHCNGLDWLCSKTMNEAVFPMTYASSLSTGETEYEAQGVDLETQLSNGIRAISLEVWPCSGGTAACACVEVCSHRSCLQASSCNYSLTVAAPVFQ